MKDLEIKDGLKAVPIIGMSEMPINPNLLAHFFLVRESVENGVKAYIPDENERTIVAAILEDGEFSLENQYSTPFENSNPEGRMPNMMGLIQSGQLTASMFDIMQATSSPTSYIGKKANEAGKIVENVADATGLTKVVSSMTKDAKEVINNFANDLEGLKGRSTFTKLNSQQIYTSSNSVKISGTLIFSAWADAKKEVEDAIRTLQEWASPKFLYDTTLVASIANDGWKGMFASEIPPLVGMRYGGKLYLPLVIESLSTPITAPMTQEGHRIAVKAQISLSSLQAWDRQDVNRLYY